MIRADFCLGDWIIRPRRGCIERGEKVVHVHPKPMAVLECLANANGEVVTRDELHETVWADTIVTDESLTQCVAELRKAFGDSARDSKVIKTIPKAGFCLVLPVETLVDRKNLQTVRVRKQLFGIAAIVVLLAVIATWLIVDTRQNAAPRISQQQPSLAVLPFINRSSNIEDMFFVDGIHDELLTRISKIEAIKTISRTSVMRYRDTDMSIPEIADELGVSTILEGGIQRAGTQIRINVQLIDARSDEHLWAEIYDRQLTVENIFAIQSEISTAISKALQAVLSPEDQRRIQFMPTESLAAYEAYLLGKQQMERRDTDSLENAVKYLTEAVEIDPQFAVAWSELGDVYFLQRANSAIAENELLPRARSAIDKALELDPELGEAYTSLGMLHYNIDDIEGAEQSYRKAIELLPSYSRTYHWYAILLREQGRYQEAFQMSSMAVQLDPLSPVVRQNLAIGLRAEGRHEEALEELEKVIAIDPTFARAYDAIATMDYQVFNRIARAVQGYVNAIQLNPGYAFGYTTLGQLYLELGNPNRANQLFAKSREMTPDGIAAHWGGLLFHAFMGDVDGIGENVSSIVLYFGKGHWEAQFSVAQLRNQFIAEKHYERALELYSSMYPGLLDDPALTIGLHNYRAAIDLALVLQKTGDMENANSLLDRSLDFIRDRPRLGWWGGYWISDVLILALKGEKARALTTLSHAVDEGWRSMWWYYLRHDPNLDSIRSDIEFQRIIAEIETDMSAQMQLIRKMEKNGEIAAVPDVVFIAD